MVKSYETVQPVPFGSYQLVERLAMGGMAEVYLARPDNQPRFVALKRILPNIAADDEFIAMFIDEAKIAGQLNHPNVAQIFDLGKINSSYFIAMEYVSGHDVRALWDRTRDGDNGKNALPIGLACYIVKKICDGLDYAHRRRDAKGRPLGIIHRDVSPQNILVSYDGDLKIIDFGIAKAANRIVKTQTGILKGKFAYMAPEQARGEPTDHRADIFAIGVILYELLTGERTFKAESDFALLEKVRRVDMPAPRSLRSEIPKDLERIVYKALAKEAGDRYAWASALGTDLDRFMSDQGYASSKEELGAFLQRTFKPEFQEEQRRLAGYRTLFDDEEPSSTRVKGSRPSAKNARGAGTIPSLDVGNSDASVSSTDGTEVGDSVSVSSDANTSFEQGATEVRDPKAPLPRVPPKKNGDVERSLDKKRPGGDSTAQIVELRDKAARIAAGASMSGSSAAGTQASLMASVPEHTDNEDDSDDDIDKSEEASALGGAIGLGTQSQTSPLFSDEPQPTSPTAKNAGKPKGLAPALRPRAVDETQIDPTGIPSDEINSKGKASKASGGNAVVARDEMPKKLRVVSSSQPRPREGGMAKELPQTMPPPPMTGSVSAASGNTGSSGSSGPGTMTAALAAGAPSLPTAERGVERDRVAAEKALDRVMDRDRPDRDRERERDRDKPLERVQPPLQVPLEERSQSRIDMGRNERSGMSRASPSVPMPPPKPPTVAILVAAFLGAIIGGGGVGIAWLMSHAPTSTVMFVATPRQTEVRLGDEVLCTQTPCAVLLEPGKHEIRFKAPGAEQLSRNVEVKTEGTPPVEVVLERVRDDLRLETSPPGAQVTIDDKPVAGQTPLTLPKLVVGKPIRLKIAHEGFEPFEVNRTVDDEAAWRYELPTSVTAWTVATEPPDANLDGPNGAKELPGNKLLVTTSTKKNAQLTVKRPGCTDKLVTLSPTGKAAAAQTITLECNHAFDTGVVIVAPKRSTVMIDNVSVPKTAKLDPYPLASGRTYNIFVRSPRGRTFTATFSPEPGKASVLDTKLKN